MNFLIIILNLLILNNAFSKANVAVVTKMRGRATQLRPGEMIARKLKIGDLIKEDTSILTSERSFVRIIFINDKSLVNIGPNSKMVIISSIKDEPTFVSLLKGTIRAKIVRKKFAKKHKFFVRTKHAALGVRGTDFETIYNPNNDVTSLITFKGKVSLVKIDESLLDDLDDDSSSNLVSRDEKNPSKIKVEKIKHKRKSSSKKIDKLLSNKNAVIVRRGQYSGSYKGLSKVSKPVNMHPVQLNALYKNNNLVTKKDKNLIKTSLTKINHKELTIRAIKQDAPIEGFFDKKTGDFAPRAGGLIDLKTGIYIPPTRSAKLDLATKVFVDDKIGSIDPETGQYIAPKGLILDEDKGFIVSAESKKNKKLMKQLKKEQELLNNTISSGIVFGNNQLKSNQKYIHYYTSYELEELNRLSFSLTPRNYKIGSGNNSRSADNSDFLQLSWIQPALYSWQPILKIGVKRFSFNPQKNSNIISSNSTYFDMYLGVRKNYSQKLNFEFYGNFFQDALISRVDEGNGIEDKVVSGVFSRAGIKIGYKVLKGKRISLNTNLGAFAQLGVKAQEITLDKTFGATYDIYLSWWWSKTTLVKVGGYSSFFNGDITRLNFSSNRVKENAVKFSEGDVKLEFVFVI